MQELQRITQDPDVMGGKACIRGMRVTVGMILGLLASGRSEDEILEAYPYLQLEDIREALSYAAMFFERFAASNDQSLSEFFRQSYLAKFELELERDKSSLRDVPLLNY